MTNSFDELARLKQELGSTNTMLEFVLAHGLPMARNGKFRYHGLAEPIWHDSQRAAILAAMAELPPRPE
jgi:hypothetical protein